MALGCDLVEAAAYIQPRREAGRLRDWAQRHIGVERIEDQIAAIGAVEDRIRYQRS